MFINSAIEYSKGEISNPIKLFADDFFFPLDFSRQQQANLYLREANLQISKSWYKLGSDEYKYHKIDEIREYA